MSLLDRLRPKWQSADTEVRAQAVRDLPKEEADLLASVAQQDPDPRVRRIAVKKLESPRLLLAIADTDGDESLRSFAKKRARQHLVHIACDSRDAEESKRALLLLTEASDRIAVAERAHFPDLRAQAFEMLTGDDALFEVVRRAKDPEMRGRALARISSPQVLKRVVLDEGTLDIALPALARIDDPDALESIFDQHTLPRSVRRQAFSKLEKLVPPDHPIKARARQERFQELREQAEKLAEGRMPSSASEVAGLRESWAAIEAEGAPDPKTRGRFEAALEALEALAPSKRIPEPAPPESEAADAPEAAEAASREPLFVALLDRIEALPDAGLASSLDSLVAEWKALSADGAAAPEMQARFRRAL
ncbi:MAG TPA: hypothetical protein VJ921_00795, partial [Vicinamibacteria bacterium]|nr:hypothetical protein [Vicinamibacteria bacterium]